ncbi:MAG: glycoside hydrolase family 65 protein [Solirubrobacteraceae bacterium]
MLKRAFVLPPEHVFPTDEWRIVEARFSESYANQCETAFALSNGYFGVRGVFDEGTPAYSPGVFVSGFHEQWPILHAETAYGLARTGQTIVNVPDATTLRLYVDDEPLSVATARMAQYARVLDMRAGTLARELVWETAAGKRVVVRSCRIVSLAHRHLMAVIYEVVLPEDSAPIAISSMILNRQDVHLRHDPGRGANSDPRRATLLAHRVLNAEVVSTQSDRMLLGYQTTNSAMTLGVGVDHVIEAPRDVELSVALDGDVGEAVLTADAQPGVPIRIIKYITYQSSRSAPSAELVARCGRTLDRAVRDGPDALLSCQRAELDRFWESADVVVESGEGARMQQAIRWNLFQLCQATWRVEEAGVPRRGLTAQAYEGHYFWDTEIYVLPFLSFTQPRIACNLLRFRHSMLAQARSRAREINHKGALFPWRTINGEEASAAYQAGTAQYHLNADIAFAIRRYVNASDDREFLAEAGAELLVETARMWADLGFYAEDGRFHVHNVTGPDEYTTVVNDNTYTNLMARLNLSYAAATVRAMQAERPAAHAALVAELRIRPEELDAWERAAAAMYVPYDERRGIHPQDANFLERERWDLEATPPEHFPLALHYHPLVIYRHQVLKQTDVVLAMLLLGDEFSEEQKRANFDYYDALTTGDSSLSACIQSIVAAEIGKQKTALEYFRSALLMDLANVSGNMADGVHVASAAGVWRALVFGFGGVREYDEELSITPHLPAQWDSLSFSLRFRGRRLQIRLTHDEETYTIEHGDPLKLTIQGDHHLLAPGKPLTTPATPRQPITNSVRVDPKPAARA